VVVTAVRRYLRTLRSKTTVPGADAIVAGIRADLHRLRASRITPVINGTGILVHTNLGRAPLSADSLHALTAIGAGYSTLEYSLADGARGGRAAYLEHALAILCGAEAATVVNNNAAALVLIIDHFCRSADVDQGRLGRGRLSGRPEVVISRGELLQIGGGFRIPEILEARGARLREVGTTNQTSVSDYARAITRNTALIMKVHRSNFFMDGFVDSPSTDELATLARKTRVPLVEDLGSGAIVQTQTVDGVEHEPTPSEVLKQGVDLVCFSGDKLFGGPQAGIIVGRKRMIDALKREPLFRALRCDKLTLSALESDVDTYLRGGLRSPVIEMMQVTTDELRGRAERIVAALAGGTLSVRVGTGRAQIGGGTLPRSALPSVTIEVSHATLGPQALAARLRERPEPVIAYVGRGSLKLDLRTIFPHQDASVISALVAVSTST
jgi:L-seryl-tRNA(Ser) seleniumtransferase